MSLSIDNKIKVFFSNKPEIDVVYLFGSAVSGKLHTESDIDIAVLFQKNKTPSDMQLIEVKADLNVLMGKEVDLISLNQVSPILQMQVIKKGKKIIVQNDKRLSLFIIRAFTDYCDLKIIRRPIEEKILKERIF